MCITKRVLIPVIPGNTWSAPVQINPIREGMPIRISDTAIASAGNNVVALLPRDTGIVNVMTSTDAGVTWSDTSLGGAVLRSVRPVIDGNNLNIAYQGNESYTVVNRDIYFTRKAIGSFRWDISVRLTTDPGDDLYPDMAVSGDNVFIVWESNSSGKFQIYYLKSTDGGVSWTNAVQLTNSTVGARYPKIEVVNNRLAVGWIDFNGDKGNVVVKYSKDGGQSWTTNFQLTNNIGVVRHMDMTTDGQRVYLVWEGNSSGDWQLVRSLGLVIPGGTGG